MTPPTLRDYLRAFAEAGNAQSAQLADTIRQVATAAVDLSYAIRDGVIGADFAKGGARHDMGDAPREIDLFADNLFLGAARRAGLDHYASEELERPVALGNGSGLAIAIDPFDGSANIETNLSMGTIFSILPSASDGRTFAQSGTAQLAAGFFVYGPQLTLALTLGRGTRIFAFNGERDAFVETHRDLTLPAGTREFAINASNYRHWEPSVRAYVDDCMQGAEGPGGQDYNMRWLASLVAETYRILVRGGAFLYPCDARQGYRAGRLRLVYEANPVAMLLEQAGGAATDGARRILELTPASIHQRTGLIFGSIREVEKIARYHTDPSTIGTRAPLFGHRGLLLA